MIRIALQAKGRLNEDSMDILKESGVKIETSKRKLLSYAENFPLEVLYLRDDDIPSAVANGIADIGIVGENELAEKGAKVQIAHRLGKGRCRISLAIPKAEQYESLEYFNGKRIATSYPNILSKFFAEKGIEATIEHIAGSVEIAPTVGMADAIFDIVSSGGTLIANGLKEVEKVFSSEAVVIANPNLDCEKQQLLSQLLFRFEAVKRSLGQKYVVLNIENSMIEKMISVLPAMKSPTLLPLADSEWSAIHAVVGEDLLWDVIERAKEFGAKDILVMSAEKIIP